MKLSRLITVALIGLPLGLLVSRAVRQMYPGPDGAALAVMACVAIGVAITIALDWLFGED